MLNEHCIVRAGLLLILHFLPLTLKVGHSGCGSDGNYDHRHETCYAARSGGVNGGGEQERARGLRRDAGMANVDAVIRAMCGQRVLNDLEST